MYTVAVEVVIYRKASIMDVCSKIQAVLDGSKRQTHRQTDRQTGVGAKTIITLTNVGYTQTFPKPRVNYISAMSL